MDIWLCSVTGLFYFYSIHTLLSKSFTQWLMAIIHCSFALCFEPNMIIRAGSGLNEAGAADGDQPSPWFLTLSSVLCVFTKYSKICRVTTLMGAATSYMSCRGRVSYFMGRLLHFVSVKTKPGDLEPVKQGLILVTGETHLLVTIEAQGPQSISHSCL